MELRPFRETNVRIIPIAKLRGTYPNIKRRNQEKSRESEVATCTRKASSLRRGISVNGIKLLFFVRGKVCKAHFVPLTAFAFPASVDQFIA